MPQHLAEDPALSRELTEYDYRYLRDLWGLSRAGACYLLGISERTSWRYDTNPRVRYLPVPAELAVA